MVKKQQQYGFGLIIIILGVVIASIAIFVAFKNINSKNEVSNPDPESASTEQTPQEEKFTIYNFGLLSLEDNTVTGDALRDFESQGLKGFYVFGDKLPGNRLNPNFEFASVKADTDIVSAIDGEVVFIKTQEDGKDSEIFLQTSADSEWIIGYDHIVDVTVKQGDNVKVGDALGKPAIQGNGLYRFEFQVNKKLSKNEDVHYCPTALLDESVKSAALSELQSYILSWEDLDDNQLYDDFTDSGKTGCYFEMLTPEQASGQ